MSLGNVLLGKWCLDWALKDSHCGQRKSLKRPQTKRIKLTDAKRGELQIHAKGCCLIMKL